jgi:hypothetical protein
VSTEWSMPRRGEACTGCHRPFAVGEPFVVHLYDAAAGYERREYCKHCQPPARPEPVAVWTTRRPAPAGKCNQSFDRATICGIFERLESAAAPAQVQLRFLLALLLWRKKVLRLERTAQADGWEVWEFVVVQTGATQRVARPDVDERQLEQLSSQLERLLAGQPGDAGVLAGEPQEDETDGDM